MSTALQLLGLALIATCLTVAIGAAVGVTGYIAGALGGIGVALVYVGAAAERGR